AVESCPDSVSGVRDRPRRRLRRRRPQAQERPKPVRRAGPAGRDDPRLRTGEALKRPLTPAGDPGQAWWSVRIGLMPPFADALRVLNDMKVSGVVEDYALAGAMAMVFWGDPIPTYDLDVLVFLPGNEAMIVSLAPLYDWAARHGYSSHAEHVMIEG